MWETFKVKFKIMIKKKINPSRVESYFLPSQIWDRILTHNSKIPSMYLALARGKMSEGHLKTRFYFEEKLEIFLRAFK